MGWDGFGGLVHGLFGEVDLKLGHAAWKPGGMGPGGLIT